MAHQVFDRLAMRALKTLPKNVVSRAFGVISDLELPLPLQSGLNRGFASLYDLKVDEAEHPPEHYPSLNAFFTRHLKDGMRGVEDPDAETLYSPVDGKINQFNTIERGTLVQAKGREYKLVDLVDSAEEAAHFAHGSYATIYLSPQDYHRIHAPCEGTVDKISYIPGQLWPVNPLSVRNVDRLFAINERLIVYMQHARLGRVAVIMVGATCVGRIGLAFDGLTSNKSWRRRQERTLTEPVRLGCADELGVFNLGSTVILLVEHAEFGWSQELIDGQHVLLGDEIGAIAG